MGHLKQKLDSSSSSGAPPAEEERPSQSAAPAERGATTERDALPGEGCLKREAPNTKGHPEKKLGSSSSGRTGGALSRGGAPQ